MHYLDVLRLLHDGLHPAGYLEIGVDYGHSLRLSRARSVAIDPAPKPSPESLLGKPGLLLYVGTSDDFFREHARETMLGATPLDLAFIDGLHEFAQVVRDLEHVERWGHPDTVVVIHDVRPRNAWEAAHAFHDGFWTGDVWRIVPFLREHRPDLRLWLTQAEPTGLLIVTGLDPAHPGMAHLAAAEDASSPPPGPDYDRLVEAYIAGAVAEPAEAVVHELGLKHLLARRWEYQTKWGMRHIPESSWRPLLDAAAELPDTPLRHEGLRACLRLIGAHWLPAGVREEAYEHLARYASPTAALWPSASWHVLSHPGADSRPMRSPAPALAAGELVVAVQTAAVDQGAAAWSLLDVDPGLRARRAMPLIDETRLETSAPTLDPAIEQMHPFVHEGRLLAFVVGRSSQLCGGTRTGLAAIADSGLRDLRWLAGPWRGAHEVGWTPLPTDDGLYAVSSWEPTEVLRIDPGSGGASPAALRPAPRIAERFRASSAGVGVPGGYLVLVNEEVSPVGNERRSFARFVSMRSDFAVTSVSPHFWVLARGQDIASGLTQQGSDVIAGFTSPACGALLVRISIEEIIETLLPAASPGSTSDASLSERMLTQLGKQLVRR